MAGRDGRCKGKRMRSGGRRRDIGGWGPDADATILSYARIEDVSDNRGS